MKTAFILACLALSSATALCQKPVFDMFGKLPGGVWQMKTKNGDAICERWFKVGDREFRCLDFKVSGADTTLDEEVRLVENKGSVFYISAVRNQNGGQPVPFRLSSSARNIFIFSNPQHDYPQTVGYRFISADSLHAWIDGLDNGKSRKVDFYYKRVNQPAP